MQEQIEIGLTGEGPWEALPSQSLMALLALVGAQSTDLESLRGRTKLGPRAFVQLLGWLQREYLVDLITSLGVDHVEERVELTDRGEALLLSMLERTCELPDLG
ncbi:MAG: hypothetical protein JRN28_04775 [Nitrososphaerota archaeon]|nr:hypothetical protein [Nitrososphaerota archaeon]